MDHDASAGLLHELDERTMLRWIGFARLVCLLASLAMLAVMVAAATLP